MPLAVVLRDSDEESKRRGDPGATILWRLRRLDRRSMILLLPCQVRFVSSGWAWASQTFPPVFAVRAAVIWP